jgi:hypothetical protein
MTEWLRNRTMNPRRSRPTPVYMQATMKHSWITCKNTQDSKVRIHPQKERENTKQTRQHHVRCQQCSLLFKKSALPSIKSVLPTSSPSGHTQHHH